MIGTFLQQLRTDANLSRSRLAELAGVSRITLWRWERDETLPRRVELQSTLEALQATSPQQKQAMALYARASTTPVERIGVRAGTTLLHRGDLLIALRRRRGWTQEEAAARANIPRTTLSRWENMSTWPSADRLHLLCHSYQVTEEELLALTIWQSADPCEDRYDLSTLHDIVRSWSGQIYQIDELECLAVAGRLDRIAQEMPAARDVLCSALLFYVNHLINRYRLDEAHRYLRLIAPLLPDSPPLAAVIHLRMDAYALRLRYRQDRRLTRQRCGQLSYARLSQLIDTVSELPLPYQSTIQGDAALSLTMTRRYSEADLLNLRALEAAPPTNHPMRLQRLLERQWILGEAGRYNEAIDIQQEPTGIEFMDAYFMMTRGKVLLGVGSKQEGQSQLQQALSLAKQRDWPAIHVAASDVLQAV